MTHVLSSNHTLAMLLAFLEHAGVVILGFIMMVVGLALGVTLVMLPVGLVIGLLGVALFVGGLFARIGEKG